MTNTNIEKLPVNFTQNAIDELKRIQSTNTDEKKLRVGVKGGGCTGLSYVLELDNEQEDDEKYEIENIVFLMKKAHKLYLQDMTVDFGKGLDARGFSFSNPNASETCGCGQSFAV